MRLLTKHRQGNCGIHKKLQTPSSTHNIVKSRFGIPNLTTSKSINNEVQLASGFEHEAHFCCPIGWYSPLSMPISQATYTRLSLALLAFILQGHAWLEMGEYTSISMVFEFAQQVCNNIEKDQSPFLLPSVQIENQKVLWQVSIKNLKRLEEIEGHWRCRHC